MYMHGLFIDPPSPPPGGGLPAKTVSTATTRHSQRSHVTADCRHLSCVHHPTQTPKEDKARSSGDITIPFLQAVVRPHAC